ncbi:hypothetical protein HJG60_008392 [Phyllostomus discolor]|uniref:Uncharacterized protein n=1 Tax=Phyllostomus discolor TaxID=89673 RepID=A0A834DN24_9CHIR|nr:hypothetical protein HJG60_008392 [Phyllostomus discolor]
MASNAGSISTGWYPGMRYCGRLIRSPGPRARGAESSLPGKSRGGAGAGIQPWQRLHPGMDAEGLRHLSVERSRLEIGGPGGSLGHHRQPLRSNSTHRKLLVLTQLRLAASFLSVRTVSTRPAILREGGRRGHVSSPYKKPKTWTIQLFRRF